VIPARSPQERSAPGPGSCNGFLYTVGLGANLGDRVATLEKAIGAITDRLATGALRQSSWWLSSAEGGEGPAYVNAVLRFTSQHTPQALLGALLDIEAVLGRVRTHRNAPRTVDLDILLAQDLRIWPDRRDILLAPHLRISSGDLVIPHPRMHRRAFVLLPLLELDPSAEIPGIGPAARALCALPEHDCRRADSGAYPCGTIGS